MRFAGFSSKQYTALKWWAPGSPYEDRKAIICDGAVRSGKTLVMSMGFLFWAMESFSGMNFGICGKTVSSAVRNLVDPLMSISSLRKAYQMKYTSSQNHVLTVRKGRSLPNRFYVFGGKDEGSAQLIQGVTLAGILLDEVALMPRSFVEQALARTLSVENARYWFNCNPESPAHWFYQEWVSKAEEKNALRLHFLMEDNPTLTPEMLEQARRLYTGVFRERFILGKWVKAGGLVYPQFDPGIHVIHGEIPARLLENGEWCVSIDYGTANPCSMGLWCTTWDKAVRVKEFYYDSRAEKNGGRQKTDEEYYKALEELAGDRDVYQVIVDPSAASFLETIRNHGRYSVRKANNDVMKGIGRVSSALQRGLLLFHESCRDTIREFGLYSWDEGKDRDAVIKKSDHAMDDMRYFVSTYLVRQEAYGYREGELE